MNAFIVIPAEAGIHGPTDIADIARLGYRHRIDDFITWVPVNLY